MYRHVQAFGVSGPSVQVSALPPLLLLDTCFMTISLSRVIIMDDVSMLEIEFDFWTEEMIAARAEYKDYGSKASEFREAYIKKTKVIQVELEASRRFCDHFAWRDLPAGEFGEPSIRWN